MKIKSTIFFCNIFSNVGFYHATKINRRLGEDGVLTPQDKIALLDLHNELRSTIAKGGTPYQPAAKNMLELNWNTTLASEAKAWADQCKTENDPNNDNGENINLRGKSDDVLESRYRLEENVLYFYGEWFHYRRSTETCYNDHGCKRYKQIAWANTESVGCGYAECPNNALGLGGEYLYQTIFICRYFPPGNIAEQSPYMIAENDAERASLCPNGYVGNNSTSLCEQKVTSSPSTPPSTVPSISPLPTITISSSPSNSVSSSPSVEITSEPTHIVTFSPTSTPSVSSSKVKNINSTATPYLISTSTPSSISTIILTTLPSNEPSTMRTISPSSAPTKRPTNSPSYTPSSISSIQPSIMASSMPTFYSSSLPSTMPSTQSSTHPSNYPTMPPSVTPSLDPSSKPSIQSSFSPSNIPSASPSQIRSAFPSVRPSLSPSSSPVVSSSPSMSIFFNLSSEQTNAISWVGRVATFIVCAILLLVLFISVKYQNQ